MSLLKSQERPHRKSTAVDAAAPTGNFGYAGCMPIDTKGFDFVRFYLRSTATGCQVRPYSREGEGIYTNAGDVPTWFTDPADWTDYSEAGNFVLTVPVRGRWACLSVPELADNSVVIGYSLAKTRSI